MIAYSPDTALELWYQALDEEFGLIVNLNDTDDMMPIVNNMYTTRQQVDDPRLECLSIHMPAAANCFMIYKKPTELER